MRVVDTNKLCELQSKPDHIRNICILAHVDHGKTTLADSLVASNGIISARMAGKLRYMDSRKDEQERGITMKSSAISLYCNSANSEYLVNLIDSPGHVDFSSEVSTAIRLCDGAIVIVDVVEGVCAQTKVALKQAWIENIQPVLVLNKMDRLITEVQLSPLDAYIHLTQILEQVNAVLGELFSMEVLSKTSAENDLEDNKEKGKGNEELHSEIGVKEVSEWASGLDDVDDEDLYFSPEKGNVVFASAVDGWGFRVTDFAKVLSAKMGISEIVLNKTLWGDFYLNSKTKRIMRGAQEKAKKPLFVQMVLENLWSVYENIVVRKDKEKLQKIVDSLKIKLTTRDMRHTDAKVQLQAVCSQWLPLASAVLDMCCEKLPSPLKMNEEKVEKLMCSSAKRFDSLPPETQKLKDHFIACSSNDEDPVIVFISKMFPVEQSLLPENRPQPLTQEEMALRREQARLRHAERMSQQNDAAAGSTADMSFPIPDTSVSQKCDAQVTPSVECTKAPDEDVFVAFARVFSGKIRVGQELFVLGPKYNPTAVTINKEQKGEVIVDPTLTLKDLKHGQHITKIKVSNLYLLMGRELQCLQEVPAGNVLGIGGLEEHVLKSCTLSSTVACPSFTELQLMATPILRVAVMPKHAADMPALVKGLRLLNQADSCVQVLVQETGEHVIVTAGEVHLQRCLDDLTERYAKVQIKASEPIVPFRETIVTPPTLDMVNEVIQDSVSSKKEKEGMITVWTANQKCCITINAVPLPEDVVRILENNTDLIKTYDQYIMSQRKHGDMVSSMKAMTLSDLSVTEAIVESGTSLENSDATSLEAEMEQLSSLTDRTLKAIEKLQEDLKKAFDDSKHPMWQNVVEKIWSFGPRRFGPNILINNIDGLPCSFWNPNLATECIELKDLLSMESSFVNGFQLATLAGPLCDEPMMGVAFIVSKWELSLSSPDSESTGSIAWGPLSGQIMSSVKEGCKKAFQAQPQRLMAAMYSCNIQVTAEALGRMYGVLSRRHGRVLAGDMAEGSGATFNVTAVLPVVESFDFAPEIRKQTSGLASPQLVFSHWEVIDLDPFWVPSTEEEYLHFGEKADSGNRARHYMDNVRRRKGLPVTMKIVEHAEKQRTLSKNK
ncbi:elongation factor-like GTPase 1 isoform X1 [Frankliniella occidentalis]|uniref:Ribosome assembly protein 1 n=1 Tax=Frankliniella occidentalis TaxID=133901 RepID=A0A6J1T0G8_FRAOC|nr:elongation factor-like GTPase 1 isoform X1 [Frankliniella occidentalis]